MIMECKMQFYFLMGGVQEQFYVLPGGVQDTRIYDKDQNTKREINYENKENDRIEMQEFKG